MANKSRPTARKGHAEWPIVVLQYAAEVISHCIPGDLARSAELP